MFLSITHHRERGSTMSKKADLKYEAFARIVFADAKKPKWEAAKEAGYKGNMNSLYVTASRLLSNAKVLAWLGQLRQTPG